MEIIKKSSDWKVINHDMEIIKNLLSFGFYYSYTYDLTLSTDKISKGQNDRAPKFWWTGFMLKDLRAQNISISWQIPLIQVKIFYLIYEMTCLFNVFKGFMKNFAVYLMGKKLEVYLISRKSCRKAGTRYNARGTFFD